MLLISDAPFIFKLVLFLKGIQIIAASIKKKKNHVLAEKVSVVDFNSEVCGMSLNQCGWPQIENCKNS